VVTETQDAGKFLFEGWAWWPVAAAAVAVAAVVTVLANRRVWAVSGGRGILCAALKLVGFVLLGLCLLEPVWMQRKPRKGENYVAVLVDQGRSWSVRTRDGGSGGEKLRSLLDGAGNTPDNWLATLGETFGVETFGFSETLERLDGLEELPLDGEASALGRALRSVVQRFRARPLAAVLVFTDGNATDLVGDFVGRPDMPPIYPVVLDGQKPAADVALGEITVEETPFEDAPVVLGVEIVASGGWDKEVTLKVTSASGGEVARETVRFASGRNHHMAHLRFRPERLGTSFYKVEIDGGDGGATPENDSRHIRVNRGGRDFRVLYVAGRPNWEYKFLNRALAEDDEISLVALLRVAKREPKFEWRGRGGKANPLFQAFGDAEAAEYDRPVLVRLNTTDSEELSDGFPDDAESLFAYDALILDDVEAAFFSLDQQALIREFVTKRGGGFLMLGGQESFGGGGYGDTPIADVLPVYPDTKKAGKTSGKHRFDLTREGLLEPWLRLRDTEKAEKQRLKKITLFRTMNRVGRAKPGATVLAVSGKETVLAAQRFGRGRSAALTVGDYWRWAMKAPGQRPQMEKAWRQMVRWLLASVPERVAVEIEPTPEDGSGMIRLNVTVADSDYAVTTEADVAMTVVSPDGSETSLAPGVSGVGDSRFEVTFRAVSPGGYRVRAEVKNYDGEVVGKTEAGWVHDPVAEEFAQLGTNLPLLKSLAEKTGGKVLGEDDLAGFEENFPAGGIPVFDMVGISLWHVPVVFLLAVFCFVLEWALRRGKGFA